MDKLDFDVITGKFVPVTEQTQDDNRLMGLPHFYIKAVPEISADVNAPKCAFNNSNHQIA